MPQHNLTGLGPIRQGVYVYSFRVRGKRHVLTRLHDCSDQRKRVSLFRVCNQKKPAAHKSCGFFLFPGVGRQGPAEPGGTVVEGNPAGSDQSAGSMSSSVLSADMTSRRARSLR